MKHLFKTNFLLAFCLTFFLACTNKSPEGALEIGLVCSDLDRSLDFYKNVIGFKETGGFEVDGQFSTESGLSNGKPFRVRLLKLTDSPAATILKLACCSDSTLAAKPVYVSDAPGMKYLTIEVKSTKAIKERLQKNGIPLLGKTPISLGDEQELIMVQDPDGVFVEIVGEKN